MNRAFSIVEFLVIISIIAIAVGMIIPAVGVLNKSAEKARKGTDTTELEDAWKTSVNKTPSSPFDTRIVTDPSNNQKWIVVTRNSNNVAILPYIKAEVKAEKEAK